MKFKAQMDSGFGACLVFYNHSFTTLLLSGYIDT